MWRAGFLCPTEGAFDVDLRAITSGELAPGDKLPSERELARRFSTARNTAREAIRLLTEEGLVTAQHGRGVFVREKQPMLRWGSERYSRRTYQETGLTPPGRGPLCQPGLRHLSPDN